MITEYPESSCLRSWLLERTGRKKKKIIKKNNPQRPAKTNLEVPVVCCIVQGGVVVQPLGVDFGACSKQLLCNIVVTPVARLVQCCPACKQTQLQNQASHSRGWKQ